MKNASNMNCNGTDRHPALRVTRHGFSRHVSRVTCYGFSSSRITCHGSSCFYGSVCDLPVRQPADTPPWQGRKKTTARPPFLSPSARGIVRLGRTWGFWKPPVPRFPAFRFPAPRFPAGFRTPPYDHHASLLFLLSAFPLPASRRGLEPRPTIITRHVFFPPSAFCFLLSPRHVLRVTRHGSSSHRDRRNERTSTPGCHPGDIQAGILAASCRYFNPILLS